MKLKIFTLCVVLCTCSRSLATEEAALDEAVIPTKIAEPPYKIGDLPSQQGYYIQSEGQTSINFRIVDNKIRLYWLDANGLIAEPKASAGNIRVKGKPKIRSFYALAPLAGEAGLGSEAIVRLPHLFNVILYLNNAATEDGDLYTFRYVPSMSVAVASESSNAR